LVASLSLILLCLIGLIPHWLLMSNDSLSLSLLGFFCLVVSLCIGFFCFDASPYWLFSLVWIGIIWIDLDLHSVCSLLKVIILKLKKRRDF